MFDKWTKDKEGTTEYKFDTIVTADITLYAQWSRKTYKVGDVGPAGGFIFYDVDADNTEDGGAGEDGLISSECGWKYLKGAPTNVTIGSESSFCFGYYRADDENTKITTETSIEIIGKGKTNTKAFVDAMGSSAYSAESGDDTTSNYAAYVASSYTFGGYNDWFLPSVEEIKTMMNVSALDVTKATALWSSTELDGTEADIAPYDASGDYTYNNKNVKHPVRPVRSF